MDEDPVMERVRADFEFVHENPAILGVLLYGSQATGHATDRSDIDICVVAPGQNPYEIWRYVIHRLPNVEKGYDVRIFEELPMYIQGPIVEEGKVVNSRDEGALYEYFFFTCRKEWEDYKFRVQYLI
ncbi:MAG: nucleotidyltransferase domain-containing protein [Promethearchaeota archaeon]